MDLNESDTVSAREADGAGSQVGLPARLDLRRALDIYVWGRGRTLGPSEKEAVTGGTPTRPFPRPAGDPGTPASVRVGVPQRLEFHRNAGTWRQSGPGQTRGQSPEPKS